MAQIKRLSTLGLHPTTYFFGVGDHFPRPYDANFLRPKSRFFGWGTTFRDPTMLIFEGPGSVRFQMVSTANLKNAVSVSLVSIISGFSGVPF